MRYHHAEARRRSGIVRTGGQMTAQQDTKPVAWRAWFDEDNGARWLFTLWPEEERLDVTWQPLYAAPQSPSVQAATEPKALTDIKHSIEKALNDVSVFMPGTSAALGRDIEALVAALAADQKGDNK
jgi:hypothetical protein